MQRAEALISWQPVLTDHQAYTFEALSNQSGLPMIAYVVELEDRLRKKQGWADTRVSSVRRAIIPTKNFLIYCIRQLYKHRKDVHFFGSPFQDYRLTICLLIAGYLGIEYYLISEPYSPNADGYLRETPKFIGKLKSLLRPNIYKFYVWLIGDRVSGVFTISRLAYKQYRKAGIQKNKLFLFGYFIPSIKHYDAQIETNIPALQNEMRIIFVGSLIRRKGIDLLIEAIQMVNRSSGGIYLDIYGSGDVRIIERGGENVRYCGIIPFGAAQAVIAKYHLLVLPSRYDGWGVVVNEAICAGVPVVCSSNVGSGEVALELGVGAVFKAGDINSLSELLLRLKNEPLILHNMKKATAFAENILQPKVAASYILDVVNIPRDQRLSIKAPWYSDKR